MTMDINIIFKIATIGILVSILNILLTKSGREDINIILLKLKKSLKIN